MSTIPIIKAYQGTSAKERPKKFAFIFLRSLTWSDDKITAALKHISKVATVTKPNLQSSVLEDAPDNRVLECAKTGKGREIQLRIRSSRPGAPGSPPLVLEFGHTFAQLPPLLAVEDPLGRDDNDVLLFLDVVHPNGNTQGIRRSVRIPCQRMSVFSTLCHPRSLFPFRIFSLFCR